jgi:hypothetical protein
MSDAGDGDEIVVDEVAPEAEVVAEVPKGKMTIEDALQVAMSYFHLLQLSCIAYSKS